MKIAMILWLVLSFLRVDLVYAGLPNWEFQEFNGLLKHDSQSHVFQVNVPADSQVDNWWILATPQEIKKMNVNKKQIPEKKKLVVILRSIPHKPEQMYEYMTAIVICNQKRMKIALVSNPCSVLLNNSEPYSPVRTNTWPQSQIVLAASLQQDFNIEFLDLRSISHPSEWREKISDEYKKPLKYNGLTLTRHLIGNYRSRIANNPADAYVLTANFTAEANSVAETIWTIKQLHPDALVLVGGRDAGAPERHSFYFRAGADYIGVGDGDVVLPKFLSELEENSSPSDKIIRGDIGKKFIQNVPDFSLKGLNCQRYTESGGGPILDSILCGNGFVAYTETSRGCPRECAYCTEAKTPRWEQSLKDVKDNLDYFINAGCRLLMISDDNLLWRRDSDLIEIFTYLREKNVAWEFPVGLEIQLLTDQSGNFKEDLFEALFWNSTNNGRFVGAHRLLLPFENVLLKKSNLRKLSRLRGKTKDFLNRLLETDMPFLNVAVMIGAPNETTADRIRLEDNLKRLYDITQEHSTRVNFSIFCTSPLPGTPFGREMTATKRLSHSIEEAPELWTVFTSVINGEQFSATETTRYRNELLAQFGMSQKNGKVSPS